MDHLNHWDVIIASLGVLLSLGVLASLGMFVFNRYQDLRAHMPPDWYGHDHA